MDKKQVKCPNCKGNGEYDTISTFEKEEIIYPVKCTVCVGTGRVNKSVCYTGKYKKGEY